MLRLLLALFTAPLLAVALAAASVPVAPAEETLEHGWNFSENSSFPKGRADDPEHSAYKYEMGWDGEELTAPYLRLHCMEVSGGVGLGIGFSSDGLVSLSGEKTGIHDLGTLQYRFDDGDIGKIPVIGGGENDLKIEMWPYSSSYTLDQTDKHTLAKSEKWFASLPAVDYDSPVLRTDPSFFLYHLEKAKEHDASVERFLEEMRMHEILSFGKFSDGEQSSDSPPVIRFELSGTQLVLDHLKNNCKEFSAPPRDWFSSSERKEFETIHRVGRYASSWEASRAIRYLKDPPGLLFSCNEGTGDVNVFFVWNKIMEASGGTYSESPVEERFFVSGGHANVEYRLDSEKSKNLLLPTEQDSAYGSDSEFSSDQAEARNFLEGLLQHKLLRVRAKQWPAGWVVARFDLQGLREALGPFSRDCDLDIGL